MAEEWVVIYRALADFDQVIRKAAEARAALAALEKQAKDTSAAQIQADLKAAQARQSDITSLQAEKRQYDDLAVAAKSANEQTLFGGRPDMAQHLADLQREADWTRLINRARWYDFSSVQAYYSYNELLKRQAWEMNRAKFGATSTGTGYTTPDQYLSYLQREYVAERTLSAELKARADVYRANADAALAYAAALAGTSKTLGTLSEGHIGGQTAAQSYVAEMAGIPSQITTTMNVDDSAAISKILLYRSLVGSVPRAENTVLTESQMRGAVLLTPPPVTVSPHLAPVGGSVGVGAGPPPADAAAWTALAGAQQAAGNAAQSNAAKLLAAAAAATTGADAAKYAYAAQIALGAGQGKANTAIAAGIPLYAAAGGWLGFLGGKTQLFGGALTALGVPAILAAASGLHILIDGLIELAAVVVPAAVAFTAFGVAAIPTVQQIYQKMQAVYTTSQALGISIYPLTGQFQAMAQAVQPSVYQLFGEALVVINHNTGLFTQIAVEAGKALDTLGARAAVALTSGGMGTFLAQGPADLAKIGDIIGNIFGTIGNLLHVIPGYAQVLLGALDGLTKGLESVTASPIGQWAAGAFLALHGFVLWAGLGATGAVLLGNALLGLAAKFGLVAAGATVFNAAAFGAGIKQMLGGIALLAGEMFTLGAGEDVAAAGALTLEGAWAAITAINPVVWIGAAIGGLVALALWLGKSTSATQSYNDAVNTALKNAPVDQVSVDITRSMATTTGLLSAAQDKLNTTQKYGAVIVGGFAGASTSLTDAYSKQAAVVAGYQGELKTLQADQANYNTALQAAGGNTAFLTGTSISLNDAITQGGQTLKEYLIEVQANADAQQALGLGIGRSAAAQNAQTNQFLTQTLPAMQKVTQAEDTLISLIISGEQAFVGYQQSVNQFGTDLQGTGIKLGGFNAQALTVSSDFYNQVIPGLQKTIDTAQQMGVSTEDLTKIIATQAGEIQGWTDQNTTAKSVMVSLINNALGPGTVSMQTVDKWVQRNSTDQNGLNALWATATINAGNLTGVLKGMVTQMFQQDLLLANHVNPDMQTWIHDVLQFGQNADATKGARQQLITDLENSGFSARDAADFVKNNLQGAIDNLHGKNVTVGVNATGSGGIQVFPTPTGAAPPATLFFKPAASGGLIDAIPGGFVVGSGGGPRQDNQLARLSSGEYVINAGSAGRIGLPALNALNRYQSGGMVDPAGLAPWAAATAQSDLAAITVSDLKEIVARDKAQIQAAAAAVAAQSALAFALPGGGGAAAGTSAAAAQAWARAQLASGLYGWGLSNWPPLLALWNQESGWRWDALNPSSGAYGIPQALPADKMAAAGADWRTNPVTQMRWGLGYIRTVYGSPFTAEQHELANNWYAGGGPVNPAAFARSLGYHAAGGPVGMTPEWGAVSSDLNSAAFAESASFWALMGQTLPKAATPAQHQAFNAWSKALQAQQLKTFGLGRTPPGAYGLINKELNTPSSVTSGQWGRFLSDLDYEVREVEGIGIPGGINPPGTPRDSGWTAWHYFRNPWQSLLNSLRSVQAKEAKAQQIWGNIYGPGHFPYTPGVPGGLPGSPIGGGGLYYNLESIATMGGPGASVFGYNPSPSMGFAAGGPVPDLSSLFTFGIPAQIPLSLTLPPAIMGAMSGGSTWGGQQYPRTLSDAGARTVSNEYNVVVNNPSPRAAESSITAALNKAAFLAGRPG